jgi:hypothetical protein|nr:MAG TPA: hypothetical protein [Caudoviricetes sp.]
MDAEYIKALNLNPNHKYELISRRSEDRKGRDTDYEQYREYDEQGNDLGTFTIADTTSHFPPQKRTITRV